MAIGACSKGHPTESNVNFCPICGEFLKNDDNQDPEELLSRPAPPNLPPPPIQIPGQLLVGRVRRFDGGHLGILTLTRTDLIFTPIDEPRIDRIKADPANTEKQDWVLAEISQVRFVRSSPDFEIEFLNGNVMRFKPLGNEPWADAILTASNSPMNKQIRKRNRSKVERQNRKIQAEKKGGISRPDVRSEIRKPSVTQKKDLPPNPPVMKPVGSGSSTSAKASDVVDTIVVIGLGLAIAAGIGWFLFHSLFAFHPNTASDSYRLGYQHAVQWVHEFGQAPEKQWCDDELPQWVQTPGDWLAGCHRGWENSQ